MLSLDISPRAPATQCASEPAEQETARLIFNEEVSLPRDITVKEIKVPSTPNSVMAMKLRKNCFFFTWNLA